MAAKRKAPPTMTAEQAAEFLGFSPHTLRDWRLRRVGPRFYRQGIGRRAAVMYRRADLVTFQKKMMTPKTAKQHNGSVPHARTTRAAM